MPPLVEPIILPEIVPPVPVPVSVSRLVPFVMLPEMVRVPELVKDCAAPKASGPLAVMTAVPVVL